MDGSAGRSFETLLCGYCSNIYLNPHSLKCGHIFCLFPCILSFKKDGENICCGSCGLSGPVNLVKPIKKLAQDVRDFKLKNVSIEVSSCRNCQRTTCNNYELCKHCDQYLCRECIISHKVMYSSVLFRRLLDLKSKYNNCVNRRTKLKCGHSEDATERLQQTLDGALLCVEFCLESLEVLLKDSSSEISGKLTDITNLIDSREQKCGLSKPLSKTAIENTNGHSKGSNDLPFNEQSFETKVQMASMQSTEELPNTVTFPPSDISSTLIKSRIENLLPDQWRTGNSTSTNSPPPQPLPLQTNVNGVGVQPLSQPSISRESLTANSKSGYLPNRSSSTLSKSSLTVSPSSSDSSLSRNTSDGTISTAGSRRILILQSSSEPKSSFPSIEAIRGHCQQFGKVIQVALCEKPLRAYVKFESPSERIKATSSYQQHVGNCKVLVTTSFRREIESGPGVEIWMSQEVLKTHI